MNKAGRPACSSCNWSLSGAFESWRRRQACESRVCGRDRKLLCTRQSSSIESKACRERTRMPSRPSASSLESGISTQKGFQLSCWWKGKGAVAVCIQSDMRTPTDARNDRHGGATAKNSTTESRQMASCAFERQFALIAHKKPHVSSLHASRIRIGTMSTPCRTSCRVTKVEDAVKAEAGKQMQWTCRRQLRRQQAAFDMRRFQASMCASPMSF